MPIDEVTRRLLFVVQRDLGRLVERERARRDRGEQVRYDSVSRMATWETRRGDVIGRWYGEVIASYLVRDRILRWAWAGRSSISTATHAEVVAVEGQSRGVPQLAMSVVGDLDEEEACTLARLGVLVARGSGVEFRRTEDEITFIGLFDSPRPREGEIPDPSRYSVPPPPAVPRTNPPGPRPGSNPPGPRPGSSPPGPRPGSNPPGPRPGSSPPGPRPGSNPPRPSYRSLPPIREIYGPRSAPRSSPPKAMEAEKEIREPVRSIFLPVAMAVLNALSRSAPGFLQALFVLTVDVEAAPDSSEKRRIAVVLVANDASGLLRAIDPPAELTEVAERMVEADRNDGNGPWRKLSARITPKPDGGATLHVDVL